jgi:hypothetical protein
MSWIPAGKYVLVALEARRTALDLKGTDAEYTGIGTVIAAGPEAHGFEPGDTVMLAGGPGVASVVMHKRLDEDQALVPAALIVARMPGEAGN